MLAGMLKPGVILLDADSLVYRCGFAGQLTSTQIVYEDPEGEVHSRGFVPDDTLGSRKKQLETWVNEHPEHNILDTEERIDLDPLPHVLHSMKMCIEGIKDGCKSYTVLRVFISGSKNYRDKIATIKPYKGNRDKLTRPLYYDALRSYLLQYYAAELVDGREADDEVSIIARRYRIDGTPHVVASIDKDLNQIPGWHYDYVKKIRYEVSATDALRNFWIQVIAGDSTDNVGGCYKIGEAGAARACDADGFGWDSVVELYRRSQGKPGCPYASISAEAAALENARLVKLQEWEDQLWTPPNTPEEFIDG
jgi:hypothetical protein